VIAGYARRAALEPQRFVRIQADQTPDAVRAEVLAALRNRGLLPA
jgi:thymidylate kinase